MASLVVGLDFHPLKVHEFILRIIIMALVLTAGVAVGKRPRRAARKKTIFEKDAGGNPRGQIPFTKVAVVVGRDALLMP